MRFTVEVNGVKEVIGTLSRLNVAAQNRIIGVVSESSKEIRRDARSRVAIRSGRFRRRIRTKFSKDGLTGQTAAFTRRGRAHPLSHLLEFGTAAHRINPERKTALAFAPPAQLGPGAPIGPSERIFTGEVIHPGTPAKPWLFPAYEAARSKYVGRLRVALAGAADDAKKGKAGRVPVVTEDAS